MIDPLLQLSLAVPLALLFFLAARHKQADGPHFQAQLAAYEILPSAMLPAVSRLLPIGELAAALGLLLPQTRGAAAVLAGGLLLCYAAAMAVNLTRGRVHIDCGCGATPQPLSGWLVTRNIVIAGAAFTGALPATTRALGASDIVLLVLLSAVLAITYAMVGQLTANHSVLRTWSRDLG